MTFGNLYPKQTTCEYFGNASFEFNCVVAGHIARSIGATLSPVNVSLRGARPPLEILPQLNVQVADVERVARDEVPAGLDLVAH